MERNGLVYLHAIKNEFASSVQIFDFQKNTGPLPSTITNGSL